MLLAVLVAVLGFVLLVVLFQLVTQTYVPHRSAPVALDGAGPNAGRSGRASPAWADI